MKINNDSEICHICEFQREWEAKQIDREVYRMISENATPLENKARRKASFAKIRESMDEARLEYKRWALDNPKQAQENLEYLEDTPEAIKKRKDDLKENRKEYHALKKEHDAGLCVELKRKNQGQNN